MRSILFSILIASFVNGDFHKKCRETVSAGRMNIENVAITLAEKEVGRIEGVIQKALTKFIAFKSDRISHSPHLQSLIKVRDDQPPCPQPNNTMFTTTAPTTPTPDPTTPTPSSPQFKAPKIHANTHEQDPFAQYMSTLHYYMSREDDVCNNKITDLNSVTEDQLFGFFSTLASAHPGPFCSLCHRLTDEIQSRVFLPNKLLTTDDNYHFSHLVYSHIPSPKSFCSTIAPGCHDDYSIKVGNLTDSVICLECTACMSITNVIQHKFLLQQTVVDSVYTFLRGNLFHNLCAELCQTFQGNEITLFPNGFSYDGCQAVLKKQYYSFIQVASVLLRPERFCSLELQWCELNEQPNGLHCLREMCLEYYKDTPHTRWLCSQIPDRPENADAYLNIQKSKIYKGKKDYHNDIEVHDEL